MITCTYIAKSLKPSKIHFVTSLVAFLLLGISVEELESKGFPI